MKIFSKVLTSILESNLGTDYFFRYWKVGGFHEDWTEPASQIKKELWLSLICSHRKAKCPWLIHYKSKMLHQNTFIFILYMFDGAPTLLSKIMNNGPVVYACTYPPSLAQLW